MEQHKNLHASTPPTLLGKAEKAASAVHLGMDEWLQQAMERRLREERH